MKEVQWRKTLVYGVLLSFSLAIYQLAFQPWWNDWLVSQGKSIGIAETAMGYFMAWMITMMISWYVTKRMDV